MSTDAPIPGWAEALGRVPSGLFILTAKHHDQETGMLASWVVQAGFEPPAVTVAVRRDRYVAEWLGAGCPFTLNIVPEDSKAFLKHFGRGFEPGESAFEGLNTSRCERGVVILNDSLGHLECETKGHLDSGEHRIFLAHVIGGRMNGTANPAVHIRKNGQRY